MTETTHRENLLIDSISEAVRTAGSATAGLTRVVQLLGEANPTWHWVGFYYLIDDATLKLGPYIGHPTDHTIIKVGDGVCGTAVAEQKNQLIDDVSTLDNYIACSIGTKSEIVVLIHHQGRIVGQFDLDSDDAAAFTADDEKFLERASVVVAPMVARLKDEQ
jgi:GAF domain-containing protein